MRTPKAILLASVLLFGVSLVAQAYKPAEPAAVKMREAIKPYMSQDWNAAAKLLREAAVADPNWAQPHLLLAGLYSTNKKYSLAAEEYAAARKLDDARKQLNQDDRRGALDGLGVAFAQSKQYDRAADVYREALKNDPEYAFYHYNYACLLAESGDLDGALLELNAAWEKRSSLPWTVTLPDPRKDTSFKRYKGNPKFEDIVRKMSK